MNTYTIELVLAREKNNRVVARERWSFTVEPLEVTRVELDVPTDLPQLADTQLTTIVPTTQVTQKRKDEFLRALKSWVFKEQASALNNAGEWSLLGACKGTGEMAAFARQISKQVGCVVGPAQASPSGFKLEGVTDEVNKFLAEGEFVAVWSMTPYAFTPEEQKRWQRYYLVDSV